MLRIEHCQYFIATAKAGSISKAALTLNISQPYLSQALKQLESIVGLKLLDRSPSGVQLTDAGSECLIHCEALISAANALQALSTSTSNQNILRVASFNAFAPIASYYEISKLYTNNQHHLIEVYNRDVVACILSGQAQLGVVYFEDIIEPAFMEMLHKKSLNWLPIAKGHIDIAMSSSHPLGTNTHLTLDQIKAYPLALEAYKQTTRAEGHYALLEANSQTIYLQQHQGFISQLNLQTMGFNNMRSLLYYLTKNTTSITFGQGRFNRNNPQVISGELVYIPLIDAPFQLISGLVYSKRHILSEIERQFIQSLKNQVT